jgi:hypothetical protein
VRNRNNSPDNTLNKDCTIIKENKSKENIVNIYQRGLNIKSEGRLKGNMQYVEDS